MKTFIIILQSLFLIPFGFSQDAGFQWAGSFGSFGPDYVNDLLVDADENVYMVGAFQNLVDFDPGPGVFEVDGGDAFSVFILKLNSDGEFLWVNTYVNGFTLSGASLAMNSEGNIVCAGTFRSTLDFNSGPDEYLVTSEGGRDCFLLNLNPDGDFNSVQTFGGLWEESSISLTIDGDDNTFITGFFNVTTDFDPGPGEYELTTSGNNDIFILKLDAGGNFIWASSVGGSLEDGPTDIKVDAIGNVFVCGSFRGDADFNPGPDSFLMSSAGFQDGFILKLNTDGNFEWAAKIGAELGDIVYACALDSEGNIFSVGLYTNSTDFDPGIEEVVIPALGLEDAYVQKLSNDGEFIYVKTINTSSAEAYNDIYINDANEIYLTGFFSETADFDPGADVDTHTSNGSGDYFVQKFDSDGDLVSVKTAGGSESDSGEQIFVTNTGEIYLSGRFRMTVDLNPNAGVSEKTSNGNVDIFILKLKECSPNSSTDVISACNSYIWIDGLTYSEDNNTANVLFENVDGCDSIVTLDLTIVELDNGISSSGATLTSDDADATYQWLDCNAGYSEIPGETSMSFTAVEDGSYAVRVQQGECVDTSECITIAGVGIGDEIQLSDIKVFPNPSNGKVYVNLEALSDVSINVYALNGEVVYTANNLNDQIYSFQLNVETGIYILEVMTNEHLKQLKLVVE